LTLANRTGPSYIGKLTFFNSEIRAFPDSVKLRTGCWIPGYF
jgi:hypothetical protein